MGTATRTGQPARLPESSDLKDLIPAIGSQVGINDIGAAITFYKKHRGVIAAILGLFGIGKKDDVPTVPTPVPAPVPEPGTPTPVPPQPERRRVAKLRAKYTLIERKNRPGEPGGGRHILSKPEFDSIVAGNDYLRLGDRVHIDITPEDDKGVAFQPGGEENRLLLKHENDDPNWTPNHRINQRIEGEADLTSEYDDYGCTPVLTIPLQAAQVDSDVTWTVGYQPLFDGPGGVIEGPRLPDLRVKA